MVLTSMRGPLWVLTLVSAAAGLAEAQTPLPQARGCPEPAPAATVVRDTASTVTAAPAPLAEPDIVLFAAVSAREVRFNAPPQLRVRLCWGTDTLRVVERRNLPSPVVAGTTYRDVYVAVELLGRLNAECLVRALGIASGAASADHCAALQLQPSGGAIRAPPR